MYMECLNIKTLYGLFLVRMLGMPMHMSSLEG